MVSALAAIAIANARADDFIVRLEKQAFTGIASFG
jgi:hypothetical protein